MTTETHAAEEKGKRYAIVVEQTVQEKLAKIAKTYKISQGAVVETLMDSADMSKLEEAFKARREAKVAGRTGKTAILKRLSKLTPEQLEALAAQLPKDET